MMSNSDQKRPPLSSSMVEDRPAEWLKKRLKDLGLIVNAGSGKPVRATGKKKGGKK